MNLNNNKRKLFLASTVLSLATLNAQAAGFEKSVMFSGRYAPLGGAVSAYVSGPEALFFNPAGLSGSAGLEATLNGSPTFSKFSAPSPYNDSETTTSFPFSVGVRHGLTPQLGVAVGISTPAGTTASYGSTVKNSLAVTEVALGAGYELLDGLRLGASYRIAMIKAELVTQGTRNTTYSKTQYNGFRVGLQYSPKDQGWGVGAQWRNKIETTLTGRNTVTNTDDTMAGIFPQAISAGGFLDLGTTTKALLEYTWTEYSKVSNWKNMNNYRLGVEYTGIAQWTLRGGYVLTSQVVPSDKALPTVSSPGLGHTILAGVGTQLMPNLGADVGAEYSMSSGDSAAPVTPSGKYTSGAYAVHVGLTYEL